MKLLKLLIFLVFLPNFAKASVNADSLFSVWNNQNAADSSRLKAISSIVWDVYIFRYPDSAFIYAQQEFEFAHSVNDFKYQADAVNKQGISLAMRGMYAEALNYFNKGLDLTIESGDRESEGSCYGNIANIYWHFGQMEKAIDNLFKSL